MAAEHITEETVMARLDEDYPYWATDWADQRTLAELAAKRLTMEQARKRTIRALWPIVRVTYGLMVRAA